MPKKLKLHPNERIDLGDFNVASSGYTDTKVDLALKQLVVGDTSYALNGYKIEISDQAANSGQITVHNGAYINKNGTLVTNDESELSSETISLLGSNQTFYIEIEEYSSDVDIDSRAIWDPTYDNGTGKLKGREFMDEVTTRTQTVWRIKSPVSTTGFSVTGDASSTRIPLAILRTNSTGQITAAVNPGLVVGPYSTVLVQDAPANSTSFTVLDATLLPESGSTITIGTANLQIQSINHATGLILTTTGIPTVSPKGTIVLGPANRQFVHTRKTATSALTGTSTHPDKLARLFAGNEDRGDAIISSPYVPGTRDDSQLQTLRDEIDFLAAQLREIKIGNNKTFPSNFSAIRYYDYAGSIQGSKSVTFTIGNGTSSIGDFNGTNQVPFQNAISAAIDKGRTDVVIFVKQGTYVFDAPLTASINVTLIGESSDKRSSQVSLSSGTLTAPLITFTSLAFEIIGIKLLRPVASNEPLITSTAAAAALSLANLVVDNIQSPLYTSLTSASVVLDDVSISTFGAHDRVISAAPISVQATNIDVAISGSTTNFVVCNGPANKLFVDRATFTTTGNGKLIFLTANSTLVNTIFSNAIVNFPTNNTNPGVLDAMTATATLCSDVIFNTVTITYTACANATQAFKYAANTDCQFVNVDISMNMAAGLTGTDIYGILGDGATSKNLIINKCRVSVPPNSVAACIANNRSFPDGIKIHNCYLEGGALGIGIWAAPEGAEVGRAAVSVVNNIYEGNAYDLAAPPINDWHFGFRFIDIPGSLDLSVFNNSLSGLRAKIGSIGIEISNQTASTAVASRISIVSNTLRRLKAETTALGISAFSLQGITTVRISGNQLGTFIAKSAGAIYQNTGRFASITENTISGMNITPDFLVYVSIIYVVNVPSIISNNVISDSAHGQFKGIHVVNGATLCENNSVIGLTGLAIYLENASLSKVQNNYVNNAWYGVAILGATTNTKVFGVSVIGNTITFAGIAVVVATTTGTPSVDGAINNTIINDNNMYQCGQGIFLDALYADRGSILDTVINGNTIYELAVIERSSKPAIQIAGSAYTVVSNNIINGQLGAQEANISRASIHALNSSWLTITSNKLRWNVANDLTAVNQANIYLDGITYNFTIVANIIIGKTSNELLFAITLAGNTNNGIITNNMIGGNNQYLNALPGTGTDLVNVNNNPVS